MNTANALEFHIILNQLADLASSSGAKEKALSLSPSLNERECRRRMAETTDARRLLDSLGSPPLSSMDELDKALELAEKEFLLLPEQLEAISRFLAACKRMKSYLKRAETLGSTLASYNGSIAELAGLREEIDRSIRNGRVDDGASAELRGIRRKLENMQSQIKEKLDQLLRSKKEWFSEGSAVMRNGRWVLPVKKKYKNQLGGTVVGTSSTGGTCFMEPASVSRLREEIAALEVEEDAEVRRILYTLSGMVDENLKELRWNIDAMEALDFAFAKARLSAGMKAIPAETTTERRLVIRQGRHPLLRPEECVPLDFEVGGETTGIIITGPNTGGKTVALKTVGLLCMMAQAGLHVPAENGSVFCMRNAYLCDIGDGQSIAESLSTFSAHITNIISILNEATEESLILLDELGSGTDPAEGMGIAIAILEELRHKKCLFAATTHYPEVKEYAAEAEGLVNARMAFDRESLCPLYRLEIGEAGESCALYIAKRLGLPPHMLELAYRRAYLPKESGVSPVSPPPHGELFPANPQIPGPNPSRKAPKLQRDIPDKPESIPGFQMGDSVEVLPGKEIGIVFRPADEKGMVCVQIKGKKKLILHKRLKRIASADVLYPPDYDFSILFDSVENRKALHQMGKRHRPDLVVRHEDERDWN